MKIAHCWLLAMILLSATSLCHADDPLIVVAEGERFQAREDDGWQVLHQDQSYATQTFGGMWVTHGGLLGVSHERQDVTAVQTVQIPEANSYRVWSKYQAPPYFNYLHRIEIWQRNRKVYSFDYGKVAAKRMYSFCGKTVYGLPPQQQIWFSWGVDHDAAEAPPQRVRLAKGPAEIRLIALPNPEPAGDRFVDFVLLTSSPDDTCIGWEKHGQAKSPFTFEALHATPIYLRFENTTNQPAKASLFTHFGHFTWHCAPKRAVVPEQVVGPGKWSPWVNINEVVELVTDEGLQITLVGEDGKSVIGRPNTVVPTQIALAPAENRLLGEVPVPHGETVHFPVDIVWNREQKLQLSKDIAAELTSKARTDWRKASPQKPQYIPFYGSFSRSDRPWAEAFKNTLGYNTLLSNNYKTLKVDGYHQHLRNEQQIRDFATKLGGERTNFRVCSFGDEISLGTINFQDPQYVEPFRKWLKQKRLTASDLGVSPDQATLTGNRRLQWYAQQFSAEQRFAHYRRLTGIAKQAFGPQVLTGANYSPHHDVMYYGNHLQWIDAFKHRAMSMFWTEDYIFFVPELPQTMSFLLARAQCAVKYHKQPIHMYVMPHAPGQPADYFRRNVLLSIGAGAKHIDHFWVAPQENYSENYVSWQYPDTFQAIYESTYDTAAVEPLLQDARRRPARIAVVTGKATALNEDHAPVNVSADRFLRMCHLASKPVQNICRKDQQLIYLALRQAQYQVDLITEDDIIEGNYLDQYQVVYFAGEWVNARAVPRLEKWVRDGGVLYASTGLGHLNQYNEKESSLLALLGVSAGPPRKNLYHHRPLCELPLAEAVGTSHADDLDLEAIAFLQQLRPTAPDVRVLVRWQDGTAAVTERALGRGKVFAVGTAIGASFWKTALRPVPWARGGRVNLYNPVDFQESAWRIMNLGAEAALIDRQVECSQPSIESLLLDNAKGTLVTLINWTNEERLDDVQVTVKRSQAPREVFSVTQQKSLEFNYRNGKVSFVTELQAGDFIMLKH